MLGDTQMLRFVAWLFVTNCPVAMERRGVSLDGADVLTRAIASRATFARADFATRAVTMRDCFAEAVILAMTTRYLATP